MGDVVVCSGDLAPAQPYVVLTAETAGFRWLPETDRHCACATQHACKRTCALARWVDEIRIVYLCAEWFLADLPGARSLWYRFCYLFCA